MLVKGAIPGWRKAYLAFLLLLFVAQTVARIASDVRSPGNPRLGAVLHLAILAAYLVPCALLVARLPDRWRRWPIAAPVAVILLGSAHAVTTIFDVAQGLARHFASLTAPVWESFRHPAFGLSLLENVGIGPWTAAIVLAATLGFHLLLYAPVAGDLVALARRILATRLPLPRGRSVPLAVPAFAYLLLFEAMLLLLPAFLWRADPFQAGEGNAFVMAPPELLLSARDAPGPELPKLPLPGARPLVLIIVDALRRDRMGVYDPQRANTPFLSALQKSGRLHVFPSAYSTCTFSACGIVSLLSSRSWNNFGRRPPTVVDALSRYSYRSYGVLIGHHVDFANVTKLYGRGIELHDQPLGSQLDDADLVQTLQGMNLPDPDHTFLYLHMMSAHAGGFIHPQFRTADKEIVAGLGSGGAAAFARQYDQRVRQADYFIGRIFAVLREKGFRNPFVVIVADHGERLGENGLYFHGGKLDHAATSIPIMVYDETATAFPPRALTSQIDVAPTFLRAVGGIPGAGWLGTPLQGPARIDAIPLGTFETSGVIAVVDGRQYKYLCGRADGHERIERLDRPDTEGMELPIGPATAPLLDKLRALHRIVAAPIPDATCRH